MTSPRLTVDLSAIAHNVRALRAASAASGFIAVVKADGFGLGARAVAEAAIEAGATGLGVTSLDEARDLLGLGVPVLSWLNPSETDWSDLQTAEVEVAVPSLRHLARIEHAASGTRVRRRIHLHVDTGMSRDGCAPSEWARLCAMARRAERAGLVEVVAVMGHLGSAVDESDPEFLRARARFARAVDLARAVGLRPAMLHLSATAAALNTPSAHHDALRVGAGLYGIGASGRLQVAATLTAPVVQVRHVPAGRTVGYGSEHRARRDTWLGLIPVGYADGLPRTASGRACVLVAGARRPLLGWISMDQVVVDLGSCPVDVGELAVIFGPGRDGEPTPAEWAAWGSTIEHEILTGVGARVRRHHVWGTPATTSGARPAVSSLQSQGAAA